MKNADEAKDYGLDVPIYTIEYTDDNDDVISVYFGNNTGDNIYATLKGEKSIYTVSSQVIEDLNYTEEDLIQLDDYPSICQPLYSIKYNLFPIYVSLLLQIY